MILVNKTCDKCKLINVLVWVPKDMVDESYPCSMCKKGTVTYKDYFKHSQKKHSL